MPTPDKRRASSRPYAVPRQGAPAGYSHELREQDRGQIPQRAQTPAPTATEIFGQVFLGMVRSPAQSSKFERTGAIIGPKAPKVALMEEVCEMEKTQAALRAAIGLIKSEMQQLRTEGRADSRRYDQLASELSRDRNRLGKLNRRIRHEQTEISATLRGAPTAREMGHRHYSANVSHRKNMD